jgi:hypothetical protein
MTNVKKQHYVPQFYLRGFANKHEQLKVFDKLTQKSYTANVRDVAADNYFYDLATNIVERAERLKESKNPRPSDNEIDSHVKYILENRQYLENHLSRMEGRFSRVLAKTIQGLDNRHRFNKDMRPELAMMLAVQMWRTNEQLQNMLELEEKLERGVMEIVDKINKVRGTAYTAKDLEVDFDPQAAKLRHKLNLLDGQLLAETATTLENHIWIICVNDTDTPFYTSDHPIAKEVHKKDNWRSNSGFASEGIELIFPLSSKYVIHLFERRFHYALSIYDNKVQYGKADHVTYCNSRQVYASYRQIYCNSTSFDLIDEMIEKVPQLKNPKQRWT